MPAQLYAYLGICPEGHVAMYVSPARLNVIGQRCRDSRPFPKSLQEFHGDGPAGPQLAIRALQDAQAYFNGEGQQAGVLEFGKSIPKTTRKRQ